MYWWSLLKYYKAAFMLTIFNMHKSDVIGFIGLLSDLYEIWGVTSLVS